MKKIKLFKIYQDEDKVLREKCLPLELPLSKEEKKLIKDMVEYLKASQDDEFAEEHSIRPGVGLAAPQIGINKRFFAVYYINENDEEVKYGLVNPKIISSSVKKCALKGGEGCLSVEDMHQGYVKRYLRIKMKAYDHISKQDVLLSLKGYVAIVLQHEYDHLFGTLYYDHINKNNPTDTSDGAVEII